MLYPAHLIELAIN